MADRIELLALAETGPTDSFAVDRRLRGNDPLNMPLAGSLTLLKDPITLAS